MVPRHAPAVPTVERSLAFRQAPRTRIAHHATQRGVAVDELVLAFAIRELAGVLAAKVVVIAFARVAHRQEHLCAGAGANSKPPVSETWRYMQAGDTKGFTLPTRTRVLVCLTMVIDSTRVYTEAHVHVAPGDGRDRRQTLGRHRETIGNPKSPSPSFSPPMKVLQQQNSSNKTA